MSPWDADIHLSREAATQLVASQFPEFVGKSFEVLSRGWDNDAYLAGASTVFRFPRRKVAANLIDNEVRILPLLANDLSLPISVSRFVGSPTENYPYTWAGYDFMPGSTACRIEWTEEERTANAAILAEFLRALHSISVDDEMRKWAPVDELARTDMQTRLPRIRERLAKFPVILPTVDADRIEQIAVQLSEALVAEDSPAFSVPSSKMVSWVHGDLYSRHLLADEGKKLCGVIDWGDVHLGDIAGDLSIAFTFLPFSVHDDFRRTYGEIDESTWNRAKFRAIAHATSITDYGYGIGDQDLLNASRFCLQSIIEHS
jgi:aminoglycoside phosphotransferase (APT) family kinase protein